ncbi:MAG: carboxymuconolactone decarboxylase family protein [Balneolaceae bacterium]|nr:carboxymuconolactone decarboxylase family protein [Balneolaceae bacterium]
MQRIEALNPEGTTGKTKELFDQVQSKLGMVPNMMRTMGNSSAVLEGYLSFNAALSGSAVGAELGELIALTVANVNGCNYCNAAHSFIGEKLVHIDDELLEGARTGKVMDKKIQTALSFARILVTKRGKVDTEDINLLKEAGFTEGEIAEIIAHVALNIFTNYFNNAVLVEVDFPEVELVEEAAI